MELTIQEIKINTPETQREFSARVKSSVVSASRPRAGVRKRATASNRRSKTSRRLLIQQKLKNSFAMQMSSWN